MKYALQSIICLVLVMAGGAALIYGEPLAVLICWMLAIFVEPWGRKQHKRRNG